MPSKQICYLKCPKDDSVKLFKFPSVQLDAKRRQKWFALVGVKDSTSLTKTFYLCAKHFSQKQLTGNFLLKSSVPDINLQQWNHSNNESSLSIEHSESDDDDDGIRTIRVDKQLYERIMNNNIVPETPPPKHFASKNIQTGTDSRFPCAMVEYNFEKRGYCLQCYFCSEKFFIHEWDLFEMHMLYQHDGFRKNFFKAYTKTQKNVSGVQKKHTKEAMQKNDKENDSTVDQIAVETEKIGKVGTQTHVETNVKPLSNHSIDRLRSDDPLDISHKKIDTGMEANEPLDPEQRSFIFKKIILKKLCDENQSSATAPKILTKKNEANLKSNEEKISEGVNYLIHELGIDDLEFLEDIQRSSNTLNSSIDVAKEDTHIKSSINISKEVINSKNVDSCASREKFKKCKVLLKRIDFPIYKQDFNMKSAKEQRIIRETINNSEITKSTAVLKKSNQVTLVNKNSFTKLQLNSIAEKKEFITRNAQREPVDNAESEFDTIEMLIEEDTAIPNQKIVDAPSEKASFGSEAEATMNLEDEILYTYKPYDPFSNETNEVIMEFNNFVGTNKFHKNLKISSNEDSLCCSDVCSSDKDEEDSSCEYQTSDNEIRLGCTASPIVQHFIELLRLNSVLWFDRNRSVEKYDAAVSNIILELSTAYRFTMTTLEVRRSINRIKKWFLSMVNKMSDRRNINSQTLPYLPKYDVYFKKCYAFLPCKENYDKWYISQTTESTFRAKHLSVVPVHECEFCKMLFETKHSYVSHMNMKHKKCKQCNTSCSDDEKLAEHMKTHQNTKAKPNYECDICHKGYYLKHLLRAHMATHEGEQYPHVYLKDGIKVYPCRYCGKEFEATYLRKWHELKHEGPQFKCSYCEKRYYKKFSLKQHLKIHKNERDYMCDLCGKSYFTRKNLRSHQDVHFRKNSISCDICGIDINNPTNLERHKRTAHVAPSEEYTEYVCKKNGQKYLCKRKKRSTQAALYPRERNKWKCKLCGLEFPKFKTLLIHKTEVHAVNQVVPCPLCNKMMGADFIKRHIKQVHTDATLTEVMLEAVDHQYVKKDLETENIEMDSNFEDDASQEFQYIDKKEEK